MIRRFGAPVIAGALIVSCATYHEVHTDFNQQFQLGNLEEADLALQADKKLAKGRDRLLYYLNRGTTNSLMGNYEGSNEFFEQAYIFTEDYRKNPLNVAASFLTNPAFISYGGEDHEVYLVHYYKALNYLKIGDPEAALIECRRMDIQLRELSSRYKSDRKFQRDAFIHTLMGLVYDATHDYNNAFIAYRNAYNIYIEDYAPVFGVNPPQQLKKDLVRTAYLNGFHQDYDHYRQEFGFDYAPLSDTFGDLVFFWNNGLGPYKSEWSINFVIVKDHEGVVRFQNEDYGLDFPFPIEDHDYEEEEGVDLVEDLRIVRIAFPKYVERPVLFEKAYLEVSGLQYPLDKTEDINQVAFKILDQRMVKEFTTALIRFGLKKLAEKEARDEGKGWGTIVGVINAASEKADTRNWQSLPHSIYYTRVSLPEGFHRVAFNPVSHFGSDLSQRHELDFQIEANKTLFHSFHSLEVAQPPRPSQNYRGRSDRRY